MLTTMMRSIQTPPYSRETRLLGGEDRPRNGTQTSSRFSTSAVRPQLKCVRPYRSDYPLAENRISVTS